MKSMLFVLCVYLTSCSSAPIVNQYMCRLVEHRDHASVDAVFVVNSTSCKEA